jgi:hypothetical protein
MAVILPRLQPTAHVAKYYSPQGCDYPGQKGKKKEAKPAKKKNPSKYCSRGKWGDGAACDLNVHLQYNVCV